MKHQIILASASPRRKELLEQIGLSFTVQAADGEEKCEARLPQKQVEELSLHKAAEVAGKVENNAVVIGADTLVFFRGKPLGKPRNEQEAVLMLKALQGQTHQVYTGVTLIWRQGGSMRQMSFHERTDVTVWPMTEEEIEEYVRSGEPMDKAGAYGNGLLISGGSDFHGTNKPGLELATGYNGKLVIPYDIWERLKDRKKEMYGE